jgi:hypothetical protein
MTTTVRQLELFTRTAPGNLRGGELFHLLRHVVYIELANTLEEAVFNAVLKKPSESWGRRVLKRENASRRIFLGASSDLSP